MNIKARNLIVDILLTVVTCGLYGLYWEYCTFKEIYALEDPNHDDIIELILMILFPYVGLYMMEKKFTKAFKMNLMYMNQRYNQAVIEGHGEMMTNNIFVGEGKYQFNKKFTLRGELQYLTTASDQGDWAYGLLELSVLPYLMFTVSDMWNVGETDLHYYMGSITFNYNAHRIMAGYGRTRAGYNCSGGVCRYVPARRGVNI